MQNDQCIVFKTHQYVVQALTMKRSFTHLLEDSFISYNPSAPKKKQSQNQSQNSQNYGQVLDFSSQQCPNTSTSRSVTNSGSCDESHRFSALESPWMQTTTFCTWSPSTPELPSAFLSRSPPSKQTSQTLSPATPNIDNTFSLPAIQGVTPDEYPYMIQANDTPMLLELYCSTTDKEPMLRTFGTCIYDQNHVNSSQQNSWKDCKKRILKILADECHQSPLNFFLDLLDPDQDEYELYHSQWFSRGS
jgi:hypothetical protein